MIDAMLRAATGRRALLAVVALLIGGSALFRLGPYATVKNATTSPTLPEEAVTSPAALTAFLTELDEPTRAAYARFQAWDLFNLVLFGTAGVMLLGWMLKRAGLGETGWRWLIVLPLGLMVADLAENGLLSLAIAHFPDSIATSAALPWVTGTKFAVVMVMFLALPVLAAVTLVRRIRQRRADT